MASILNNAACQLVVRCAESAIDDRVREVLGTTDEEVAQKEEIETSWSCGECGARCLSNHRVGQSRVHRLLSRIRFISIQSRERTDSSVLLPPASTFSPSISSTRPTWSNRFKHKILKEE